MNGEQFPGVEALKHLIKKHEAMGSEVWEELEEKGKKVTLKTVYKWFKRPTLRMFVEGIREKRIARERRKRRIRMQNKNTPFKRGPEKSVDGWPMPPLSKDEERMLLADGLTAEEIARELGMPVRQVEIRMNRSIPAKTGKTFLEAREEARRKASRTKAPA